MGDGQTVRLKKLSEIVSLDPLDPDREPLASFLPLMDNVHWDGELAPIPVMLKNTTDPLDRGGYDWKKKEILLNPDRERWRFTFAHELGHALDFQGFGPGNKSVVATDPRLEAWRDAVAGTDTYIRIADAADGKSVGFTNGLEEETRRPNQKERAHFEYLSSAMETWARAYSQFIVARSGCEELWDEFIEYQKRDYAIHFRPMFTWAEFDRVEKEIESVFRGKSWIK